MYTPTSLTLRDSVDAVQQILTCCTLLRVLQCRRKGSQDGDPL